MPAEPQAIFDLLADPTKHALIDGSGTVRDAQPGNPERLSLGAKFSLSMKQGLPYKITNEVVEFDEPTQIAWRHIGHHVWRYRLRPVDGGTEVTEDPRPLLQEIRRLGAGSGLAMEIGTPVSQIQACLDLCDLVLEPIRRYPVDRGRIGHVGRF